MATEMVMSSAAKPAETAAAAFVTGRLTEPLAKNQEVQILKIEKARGEGNNWRIHFQIIAKQRFSENAARRGQEAGRSGRRAPSSRRT